LLGGLSDSLALAEKYFGFTELADDPFGGVPFSWHLTLLPFLILTLLLDQFLGVRSILGLDEKRD
jgi:hypothetical protein